MQPSVSPSVDHSVAVVVNDHWLDEFCEHVGSLCAVMQALARIPGNDRPHTLVREALDNCATLQNLLNQIPVWGGSIGAPAMNGTLPSLAATSSGRQESQESADPPGDNFPEFASNEELSLPAIDAEGLEETFGPQIDRMICLVRDFRERAEGDVRQLELLSIGREWTRISRLAGMLKTSAARVSAARIVVDAAALQGAARVGCRNDVRIALNALKADLRACSQQVATWQTDGVIV